MMESFFIRMNRWIGKPRGWERLVRLFNSPKHFKGRPSYEKKTPEDYLFTVDLGTMIGWHIHFFQAYEPEVREQIKLLLKPDGVALDIGANTGWHTLLMAKLVGPKGKVYAFEPNPSIRARLEKNIQQNEFSHVQVDEHAITDHFGTIDFEAPPAGDLWDATGRIISDPSLSKKPTTKVFCTTLDLFVEKHPMKHIDLIKLDVEGWEWTVFKGAQKTISQFRPTMIFEYDPTYILRSGGTPEELLAMIAEWNYQLFALSPYSPPERIHSLGRKCLSCLAIPN